VTNPPAGALPAGSFSTLVETDMIVSEKALVSRINRKLAHEGERLCKSRGERAQQNLGTYHIVNTYYNTLVAFHIEDVEKLAKELGVMHPREGLAKEGQP
jgi:hypothetical protein